MHERFWRETLIRRAVEWEFAATTDPGRHGRPHPVRRGGSRFAIALAALLVLASLLPTAQVSRLANDLISVIVREAPGTGDVSERLVESSGGTVGLRLSIVDGFAAQLPRAAIGRLAASPAILSITPNAPLQLQGRRFDADSDIGSMLNTAEIIGADRYWQAGFFGRGVGVALIDSGVSPVAGLHDRGTVVRGPDLSFESQADNLRYLDTFGHGTFMAGLIAADDRRGHGDNDDDDDDDDDDGRGRATNGYAGIAPDARIVSVKVADAHGVTDVSQVIAGIDWVVQHRRDRGFNIRVLNLSFGTYGTQSYALDPLAFAAEVAWHAGIFVVVAAGNDSSATGRLMNPALDPFVMAVGASDHNGTLSTADDLLLSFSARGDGVRNPDLVAPGRSLQGLRVPGSFVDLTFPAGRISDRFFRGSGTSQAAAIVSGAAALVIQQRPRISPDGLKALLTSSADVLPAADVRGQGAGLLNLDRAFRTSTPRSVQTWLRSTGTGSLELARGANHLVVDGVRLEGERDIFGAPFDSGAMAAATLAGNTWSGGVWNGSTWTGKGWHGNEWSSVEWSGTSWSGNEWSSYTWSGNEWSGNEWSANEWSANEWSANEWSSNEWSANEWSANAWMTVQWPSNP